MALRGLEQKKKSYGFPNSMTESAVLASIALAETTLDCFEQGLVKVPCLSVVPSWNGHLNA